LRTDCYALNWEKNEFGVEPVFEFFFVQRIGNNILHSTMKKQDLGYCEILMVFGAIHG
jgi:hypothetical protein